MRMRLATTLFTVVAIVLGGLHLGSATAHADSGVSIVSAANGVAMPWANVIEGADKAFYGASHDGGTGLGAIYKVTPDGSMAVLHSLTRTDGTGPDAPLMQGSDGRLYGTTYYDGGPKRCGTVFAMNADGSGFTVLHTFGDDEGCNPKSGLLEGDDGALYGATSSGGPNHLGVIYRMNLDGSGYRTLHVFTDAREGANPQANLIQGADGALYGTAYGGGARGGGMLFSIKPDGGDFKTVYAFSGSAGDGGSLPRAGVIQAPDGTLYGTTSAGGEASGGSVYKVNPDGSGFAPLHQFANNGDGKSPHGELLLGSDGRLYGTTSGDGSRIQGTIFSVRPDGSDFQTLHSFPFDNASDGQTPETGVMQASDGRIVGTTTAGGSARHGTVYFLSLGLPAPLGTIRSLLPASGPWGTQVLVHGAYFVGASRATFHGVSSTPSVASAQWLRVTVPTDATTGPVAVGTQADGPAGPAFTVTPTITGLSAASGNYGDTVEITGTNFTGVRSVSFNGTPATYTVDSSTQITATVPEDSTTGTVQVVTGDGTAASPAAFTITSAAPSVRILQVAMGLSVNGKLRTTTELKSRQTGQFVLTYQAQNPGSHTPSASLVLLKNGHVIGTTITMQAGTASDGSATFTASKRFFCKKVLHLQAQLTITLGTSKDTKTIDFTVNPR